MRLSLLRIFSLVAILFPSVMSAQTFTPAHDTISVTYSSGIIDVHNDITVPGANNISFIWKVISEDFSSDITWKTDNAINICDNSLCITNANQAILGGDPYTTTYPSNTTDIFKATFNLANANPGTHYVTVQLIDNGSGFDTTITFIVSKWAASTPNVTKNTEGIVLFPNPIRDEVNVVFNDLDVKNIAVYNVIGKNMIVYRTSGTSAKLDMSKFPGGVYFLRMSDGNGAIVATKRITKQ